MAFELNSLKTNKSAEQEGVWVDYFDGARLLIARMGNAKYKAFIAMKYKQHRMAIDRGDNHSDSLAEQITLQGLAKHILLGWEGIEMDGKKVEYTPEVGLKILTELPDFKADVESFASDTTRFLESALAEDAEELKKQ